MLFHVSIEADDPRHVATVFAELWNGKALPFPPVGIGSWVAFAGDDRSTLIEIYPRGTELHESPGDAGVTGIAATRRRYTATHMAIATPLDVETVLAIAEREDWPCKVCARGDTFHVIELWVEGGQLVELLTDEMQREYLSSVTIENWERMLASAPAMAA